MRHMAQVLPQGEDLTVVQVLRLLGVHGFVFLLLVLALLNIVIFMVPGLSLLFGAAMALLAAQMVLGLREPIFPAWINDKQIKGPLLRQGLDVAVRVLEKIEIVIKPRLLLLTEDTLALRAHSLAALLLGFLVAIPVPFLNLPPTLGVMCLAIGLLQRDGLFIIGAYAFGGWSLWLYISLHNVALSLF